MPIKRTCRICMDHRYLLILLIMAGACTLGCTSAPLPENCPILGVKEMLPTQISGYRLVSFSDNLGSDFYRVLLKDNTSLLRDIRKGVLGDYNSTGISGATVNILVIEFEDMDRSRSAASLLQDSVGRTISANATAQRKNIVRNNISYSTLRIDGITNANGVEFYQEFVFWQVYQYTVMAKLTTPIIGQDPHQEMLQFMDAMAKTCSP
jgi:hypothetical protein